MGLSSRQDNQTLTPAGKIVELGSPVRAKALALNPNVKGNSGAVLLMGSPQPIIVFNTVTGQVLQRFTPAFMRGTESATSKAGSFTGITYSADGKSLFFSQDDNHVVIANVDPQTGLLTNGQSVTLPGIRRRMAVPITMRNPSTRRGVAVFRRRQAAPMWS